ncbi:MAG: endonuclease, partial [Dokdonella sp.]
LEIAQQDPNNPAKMIDVYRNRSYTIGSDRAGTGSGITYNREHAWPNSLGFANSSLAAYTDTHMLWLSDTAQNASRGNKPYANCASGCSELTTEVNNGVGGGSGVYPGNSNWVQAPDGNQGSFEVWNHRKGEMARAMFYMAIRYEGTAADQAHDGVIPDLELTDDRSKIVIISNTAAKAYMGLLTTLLDWSQQDPPDAEERARDEVIYSFQGNRNPFIDHPEWATRALFDSVNPAICILNPPNDMIFKDGFDTPM